MINEQYIKQGKFIALISFLSGTFIFGAFFLTSEFKLLFVGYVFIAVATVINLGFLVAILIKVLHNKAQIKKALATCGLMLLNIPVTLFYCWIAITLMNTMRITFINATQIDVTDIKITGCEPGHILKLQPGESQTIWVDITGDCSIDIEYLSNGQLTKESVADYVTNSLGQKIEYKIGGKNEKPF
ncbi:MAG: hypothetical protein M3R17_18745 [Bacteroidota bacterium]|nr:hypothetical protein [Bacteroidota bacterium]